MRVIKLFLTISLLGSYNNFSLASDAVEFCHEGSESCTFVLLSEFNQNTNSVKSNISSINENRANTPLSPFSTFKIANSLIALDSGVIKNTKQALTYDENTYPKQTWWPPVWQLPHYDLTTAFKYSMVAIYRQLSKDIGERSMISYLNRMHYGNEDISSGLDSFWLNASMKISAVEQVRFLQKTYHNQFAFNEQVIDDLKEIMLVENKENYRLFAKTGAGRVDNGTMLGWYVGFVENSVGVHFFAFNFDSRNYAEMKANRIKVAKEHLKVAGIID